MIFVNRPSGLTVSYGNCLRARGIQFAEEATLRPRLIKNNLYYENTFI